MALQRISLLFSIAAVYDIIAGLAFCLFYVPLYHLMNLVLPVHPGYLQLAGLYVAIFGVGFAFVARDPVANRPIMILGVLMKLGFVGVMLYSYATDIAPRVYMAFGAADVVFAVLFAWAYRAVRDQAGPRSGAA